MVLFSKMFDNSHMQFEKTKTAKIKKWSCRQPVNRKTKLLANQTLFILCIFIKSNVWYMWSLKILVIKRLPPFNFAKILKRLYFGVAGSKNLKVLPDLSFDSGFQKIVLSSLLLFRVLLLSWSRRYSMEQSSNFDGP